MATGTDQDHYEAGNTAQQAGHTAKAAGHRVADSSALRWLARAGFAARGVTYILVGWIAIQAAFGNSGQKADKSGALQEIGSTPVGGVLLWLLFIGFIGMALWQLSIVAFGVSEASGHGDHETRTRLAALGRAVVYAVIAWSVLKFAVGQSSPPSSTTRSRLRGRQLTADAGVHAARTVAPRPGRDRAHHVRPVLVLPGQVAAALTAHRLYWEA